MILVKFFVSFNFINVLCICLADYCEICTNHTLCKYNVPGPSPGCQSYDSTALITRHDITQLLNKINERRNFVAMGYSKVLPQAANMKKIHWSPELATFAQRWVDQCDPFMRPDRDDQCRDLETSLVGQNIASVAGPAPGLNVKSFVETWFIQVLEYTGSVIYYNQSLDYKTNYFTQLIWAETESVGCGKAKFYVDERNVMLERLVCNFAPKGNIHGKPVYVIGYAATQCPINMAPDDQFKGLCVYEEHSNLRNLQTSRPPVSSLLRILNLSNNSVKQEIDPIRSNLKQINFNSNKKRNQKTRHVFANNTYSAQKRISPLRKQNFWKSLVNISRNDDDYLYQQERGHSHMYHGHETPRNNYGPLKGENTNQDFRGYDYTTEVLNSYSSKNYRKYYNQYHQCTRKMGAINNDCTKNDCTSEANCAPNHCTRRLTHDCQQTTTCQQTYREIPFTNPVENHIVPHDLCSCTKQTCPTAPANCNCNVNCRCLNAPCPTNSNCCTTPCQRIHRMGEHDIKDDTRKSVNTGPFQYDDMANIVVRSGNQKPYEDTSPQKEILWPSYPRMNKSFKNILQSKGSDQTQKQVKDVIDRPRYEDQDSDYLYRSFDSSIRKIRQVEDQANPLWDMDEYKYKKLPQLKSLRFTTLGNRKNRKSRKYMASVNSMFSTEPITIKLTDTSDNNVNNQPPVTEKYLSFGELMHLRKFSDGYGDYDYRRKSKNNTNTEKTPTTNKTTPRTITTKSSPKPVLRNKDTAVTTKITTSFQRKKHCTRKLTCTWTAFTATASDGRVIVPGGGELDMGSRTPPGYVDGCTRTSTCTRDYLNRNKMPSSPDDNSEIVDSVSGSDGGAPERDEDYCERRSLNVQRRNLNDKEVIPVCTTQQEDDTDTTVTVDFSTQRMSLDTDSVSETFDCSCNEESTRRKRQENSQRRYLQDRSYDDGDTKQDFSYGDLYYLVLNKIIRAHKDSKSHPNEGCKCNSTSKIENTSILLLFIVSYFGCV